MKEPKVGDRVAVYDHTGRRTGAVAGWGHNLVTVALDNNQSTYAHPKQCRRLKPKAKPKEYWLVPLPKRSLCGTVFNADVFADDPQMRRAIHVREVKK